MTARLRWELFATGAAPPEATWALVGDLRRLPEWTDADAVDGAPDAPAVGNVFATVEAGRRLTWTVVTVERRLVEVAADTDRGRLGIGVRVAPDPRGTRLVLAGGLDVPGGALAAWRGRLLDVPALRRRFDRWSQAALRLARESP